MKKRFILIPFIALSLALSTWGLFSSFNQIPPSENGKKMLAHVVYFWAKPDLSADDKKRFEDGLNTLIKIKSLKKGYVGTPAATEKRDVVDNSYHYSLVLFFDDIAAQETYQVDPVHKKFIEDCQKYWSKVIVYDSDVK